jgi:hypothetical protein
MRTVTFKSLLSGIAAKSGLDPDNLMAHERAAMAEYVNEATRWCWDYYPWPEAVRTEQRFFRTDWSASGSYVIGDEVFHKTGQAYYQCVAPGATATPGTNPREWAELTELYPAEAWTESGLYEAGARVGYLGSVYQCISDGALGSTYNVNFTYDSITPADTTYWTQLNPFHRYVAWQQPGQKTIGTPISVYVTSPLVDNSEPIQFTQRREGIASKKLGSSYKSIYLEFREAPPTFTGKSWASGSHSAGSKVYHDETGECYEASVTTSAEPPSSDWTKIDAPDFLSPAIKTLAYADWLAGDGQHEKCELQRAHGLDMLVRELDKAEYSTDQNRAYLIGPRGTARLGTSQREEAPSTGDLSTEVAAARIGYSVVSSATGSLISNFPNIGATSSSTNSLARNSTGSLVSSWELNHPIVPINFKPPELASKTSYPFNLSLSSSFSAMSYGGGSANDILVGERSAGTTGVWEIAFRLTIPMHSQNWGVGGGFGSMAEYVDNLWNPHLGTPPGVSGWGEDSPKLWIEFYNVTTSTTASVYSKSLRRTASLTNQPSYYAAHWSPEYYIAPPAMSGVFQYSFLSWHDSGALGSRVGDTYKVIIRSGGLSGNQGYNGFGDIVTGGQHFQCESAVFSPSI